MSFTTGLLDLREREGKKMKAKSEIRMGFLFFGKFVSSPL